MSIFVFSFFLFLLIYVLKKNYWAPAAFLVGVYTFSSFMSILLLNVDGLSYVTYNEPSLFSGLTYCMGLFLFMQPFFREAPVIEPCYDPDFEKRFCRISYGLSALLIIGCLLFITKIQEAFAYGLLESRQAMYKGENDEIFTSYSFTEHIGNSIVRWLSGMDYPLIIMFFYAIAFIPGKKYMKIMLIISSLSATYMGLMNGGRTRLIYWILFVIFSLLVFKDYYDDDAKKILKRIGVVFASILGYYFISTTISRALDRSTENFLATYIGQPLLNFGDFFDNCNWHTYSTTRIFPLTHALFQGRFDLNEYRETILTHTNMNIGIFYTLLGDLFVDIGLIGMLLYAIVYNRLAARANSKEIMGLSDLIFLSIFMQIILHGLFYYSLYKMEATTCIILTIILCKYLSPNTNYYES